MSRKSLTVIGAVALGAMLVVAGIAVANVSSAPATASHSQDQSVSTIRVSGTGGASAQPDKVVVRLAVEATAENATVARKRVARNVSAVQNALAELGINESQITTTDYDLYKDDRFRGEKREPKTVYRVSHELRIEVSDVSAVGSVIDTSVAHGASNIYDIRFTLTDKSRQHLRQQAIDDAMEDARSKAERIASNAGLTIQSVKAVTTNTGGFGDRDVEFAATPTAGGGSTDISSGPVSVSFSVTVTYNATG